MSNMNKYKTLYSEQILKKLSCVLYNPEDFKKLNIKSREAVSRKIKEISLLSEYSFFYSDNREDIERVIKKINVKGSTDFISILKSRLFEKIERSNSAKINNQFKKVIEACCKLLRDEDVIIKDDIFNYNRKKRIID